MEIDYTKASFKDFENISGSDAFQTASIFADYLNFLRKNGHLNYRIESQSPVGPEMDLMLPGYLQPTRSVCLVSNDYLGFSQHPVLKATVAAAVQQYGTESGASPAIGGHFSYHQQLENKIAGFYGKTDAILYTTGYTANSATLQCLLHKEDLAIVDMAVHASVYEGCLNFGPINREGGWRRLNVAVSRARYEMQVFSTLRSDHIDLNRTSSQGVAGLKAFLSYAEKGQLALPANVQAGKIQRAGLEEVIAGKIREKGYHVNTNIGCSAYKIDIGIVHPEQNNKYVLAILCDGRTYHAAKTPGTGRSCSQGY